MTSISIIDGTFTVRGLGFSTNIEDLSVSFGGIKQTVTTSVSEEEFQGEITEYLTSSYELDVLITSQPKGHCQMKGGSGKLTAPAPKFIGVSRTSVSTGGTILEVEGENFPIDSDFQLVNEALAVICNQLEYVSRVMLRC